jgi:hypothetical protein
MATAAVSTKTEVFTKEELEALRKALNLGRNGTSDYSPPEQGHEQSDDWQNDVSLLAKFLKDLRDVLSAVIQSRIPATHRRRFAGVLANLQEDIDTAIDELNGISGPDHALLGKLEKVGLLGEALLVKLDEFRDRIMNGPVLAVLGVGNTILGSLCEVLHLHPLKELKEAVENRLEYGGDDEIIKLGLC